MKRKICSFILVLLMIGTLLPFSAFAADIIASGTCGDNATWTFDSNGTLTIRGTGKTVDYTMDHEYYSTSVPWNEYRSYITSVVVENGVSYIGEFLFSQCPNLQNVFLADSVTDIAGWTFFDCARLSNVILSKNLKTIGYVAFSNTAIESVDVPSTLTFIDSHAFMGCKNLKEFYIPESLTNIEKYAFSACPKLKNFKVDEKNPVFSELDGLICSKDKNTLVLCPSGREGNFEVPSCVTNIACTAFQGCDKLTSVVLHRDVDSISADGTFTGCTSLKNINIEEGNEVYSSVDGIIYNAEKSVLILCPPGRTKDVNIVEGTENIGHHAFHSCLYISSVSIPDSVKYIGDFTFAECLAICELELPENLKHMGTAAFAYTPIKSIRIPAGITSIEEYAFYFTFPKEIIIPKSVTSICDSSFLGVGDCNIYTELGAESWQNQATIIQEYNRLLCGATPIFHYNCTNPESHWKVTYIKEPTCTQPGVATAKCPCGYERQEYEVPEWGHSFGEWAVTIQPTCTTDGVRQRWCNCGNVNSEVIKALGHDYKDGVCTRCGGKDPDYKSPVQENPFVDVSETAVYYDAVIWAAESEITSGYGNNDFRPQNPCTRAQVVTFLWRAKGSPEPNSIASPFSDVKNEGGMKPYYKAILWAAEEGITTGYAGGLFKPNDTVTRGQFVTFLWRAEGKPATSGSINGFADATKIAAPYQQAVAWAVERGITTGYNDNTFRPNDACTRWAVVLFMYRDMK